MIVNDSEKKEVKYLGIDWGEKRIGLAIGDNIIKLASPFKVVNSFDELIGVIKEEDFDEIVIGKPIKMSGSEMVMIEYSEFINQLRAQISIPIHEIDERLSSKAADALVGDKKTKAKRDAIAAMLILQAFIDKNNF